MSVALLTQSGIPGQLNIFSASIPKRSAAALFDPTRWQTHFIVGRGVKHISDFEIVTESTNAILGDY